MADDERAVLFSSWREATADSCGVASIAALLGVELLGLIGARRLAHAG